MIVVDTNVIAYLFLPGNQTAAAEALLSQQPEWCAPALWRSEFRNILAGYLRRGTLTLAQAQALQREAESLLNANTLEVESDAVLKLVRDSACSACDCEFVALANALKTRLFTLDKKLLREFPKQTRALVPA